MRGLADCPDPKEEGEAEHAESAGSKVAEEEMAEVLPAKTQRRAQAAAHSGDRRCGPAGPRTPRPCRTTAEVATAISSRTMSVSAKRKS